MKIKEKQKLTNGLIHETINESINGLIERIKTMKD